MDSGGDEISLQRRLLLPLAIYAMVSAYFDYRTSCNVVLQKDERLLRLIPLLADSVIAPAERPDLTPVLLMAPEGASFLKDRSGATGFRVSGLDGTFAGGDAWMSAMVPSTADPAFDSMEEQGVIYRIAVQRVRTSAGELILQPADGPDARQQWMRSSSSRYCCPTCFWCWPPGLRSNGRSPARSSRSWT